MKIKENNKQNPFISRLKAYDRIKILVVFGTLSFYSVVLLLLGGVLYKDGVFGEVLKPLVQENISIPVNYVRGLFASPEHITVDIKHTDYQRLSYKRKIAVQDGVLHPHEDDYVPAKIRWNGQTIKVRMRLKGDLADHWSRDHKWSFRIKSKGDSTIMGMKNFSIQHPRTRGFLNDWYLHRLLQRHGFITLRYEFIDVTINGKHLGVYAMEEHFESKLIENNQRLKGPIIRIKDHLLWYRIDPNGVFSSETIDELYSSSPIDAFATTATNADPEQLEYFNKAKDLLELFRRGELLTHQVFDIEKMSELFAILDLFGYQHSTAYSNIRFYYNPVTSLLVPIGYDTTFIKTATSLEGQAKRLKLDESYQRDKLEWRSTFFEDKLFFEKYMNALQNVSHKDYLDRFFNETRGEYEDTLGIIYQSFPAYSFVENKGILYDNQKFIRKILDPLEGIQAYLKNADSSRKSLTLELGNIQQLPIEILHVSHGEEIYLPRDDLTILQAKQPFSVVEFKEFKFEVPEEVSSAVGFTSDLQVGYKILGTDTIKTISVFPWTYLDPDFEKADFIRQEPNFRKFDFIDVNSTDNVIAIKPGTWELGENLIVPEGFTVICSKGTVIDFTNSAKILSYSPFHFSGDEFEPIVLKSSDSTGQGIVVIKSRHKSVFNNVVFDNLAAPSQGGWEMKASLSFYESDVEMANVHFSNSRAPAALEMIRSGFSIGQSRFTDSISSSLSVSFSEGRISESIFSGVGKNGIDVTGSILKGGELLFDDVASVGIIAKDGSTVDVGHVEIRDAKIASVSQDSSKIVFNDIYVENSDYGFVVFSQKSHFGSGSIDAISAKIIDVQYQNMVEEGSALSVNQQLEKNYHEDFSFIR